MTTQNTAQAADPEITAFIWRALNLRAALRAFAFNADAFARHILHWTPDPKQSTILRSGARRVIMNCSRQWGKTTLAAAKIVYLALTRPRSCCLIIAENVAQTCEVFSKIDKFLETAGMPARTESGKRVSRLLLNGSRIIGIAAREAAVRGYTADFVFLDEAARIPDEVIDALLPVLATTNGDWWLASTPMGRRGRFFELWQHGEGPDLLKVQATWKENPRISPAFIEKVRRDKGDQYIAQEFECQFVENGEYLVTQDQVTAVLE